MKHSIRVVVASLLGSLTMGSAVPANAAPVSLPSPIKSEIQAQLFQNALLYDAYCFETCTANRAGDKVATKNRDKLIAEYKRKTASLQNLQKNIDIGIATISGLLQLGQLGYFMSAERIDDSSRSSGSGALGLIGSFALIGTIEGNHAIFRSKQKALGVDPSTTAAPLLNQDQIRLQAAKISEASGRLYGLSFAQRKALEAELLRRYYVAKKPIQFDIVAVLHEMGFMSNEVYTSSLSFREALEDVRPSVEAKDEEKITALVKTTVALEYELKFNKRLDSARRAQVANALSKSNLILQQTDLVVANK